jgi:predicted nucleic acid-binding protein
VNKAMTMASVTQKIVLTDTGFWYALYTPKDTYHKQAEKLLDILETSTVLLPWPCLYETLNTKFVENTNAVRGFEAMLKQPRVVLLSDKPYREKALETVMTTFVKRSIALVDMVIRLILEDNNVHKHYLLTFNYKDFSDLCRKHQIEMLM